MKIRDLPGWPPEPGGAFKASHKSPASGEGLLTELIRVHNTSTTFTASLEGKEFHYDYEAPNSKLAQELAEVLARSIGKH
jgi:hypothetical protein